MSASYSRERDSPACSRVVRAGRTDSAKPATIGRRSPVSVSGMVRNTSHMPVYERLCVIRAMTSERFMIRVSPARTWLISCASTPTNWRSESLRTIPSVDGDQAVSSVRRAMAQFLGG